MPYTQLLYDLYLVDGQTFRRRLICKQALAEHPRRDVPAFVYSIIVQRWLRTDADATALGLDQVTMRPRERRL